MYFKFRYLLVIFLQMQLPLCAQDFSVESFVALAVSKHPSVLAAILEKNAAEADFAAAKRQLFPEIRITANSPPSGISANLVAQPKLTAAMEQKLWAGGRYWYGVDAAEVLERAAQERIKEVQIDVAVEVVDALAALKLAIRKINTMESVLNRLARFEAMMQRRVDEQVSAPIDIVLVRSRLAQAKIDLASSQVAKVMAVSRLSQFYPESPWDFSILGAGQLAASPGYSDDRMVGGDLVNVDEVVSNYPSVRRAELEAQAVSYQSKVAYAEQSPYLFVRVEQNWYHNSNVGGSKTGEPYAYVGLSYTPGSGMASYARAQVAIQKAEAAHQNIERARREVFNRIYQDWKERESFAQRRRDYQAAMVNAEAVSASYERQFVVGRLNWQQTLDAVKELGQLELALVESEVQWWAAAYRLSIRRGDMSTGVAN